MLRLPGSSCGDSQILLSQFDPIQNSWTVNLTNRSVNSQNRLVNLQNYPYRPTSLGNGFACPTANGRTRPVSHPSCGCSKPSTHFPTTPHPAQDSWPGNHGSQDRLSDQQGTPTGERKRPHAKSPPCRQKKRRMAVHIFFFVPDF